MSGNSARMIFSMLALVVSGGVLAQDPEIESLRTAIEELRADYEL